ncbi:hypothetical protein JCM10213_002265 [Rhodosporidiobolus nylandii]
MLDRLPIEIIHRILTFAWAEQTVRADDDLRSCSLTCRKLRSVAQPLLWSEMWLSSTVHLEQLELKLDQDLARHTRVVGATFPVASAQDLVQRFTKLLAQFHNLQRVDLWDSIGVFAKQDILHLRDISELAFENICLHLDTPPALPSLVELALYDIKSTERDLSGLLDPAILPALRRLGVGACQDTVSMQPFFPPLQLPLLQQLDMLQVYSEDLEHLPSSIFAAGVPVLVDSSVFDLANFGRHGGPPIQHILVHDLDWIEHPDDQTSATKREDQDLDLRFLLDLCTLPAALPSLRTVFLPAYLRPLAPHPHGDRLEATRTQLAKAFEPCKNVEVHWRRYSDDWELSRDFKAYTRGLKAQRG